MAFYRNVQVKNADALFRRTQWLFLELLCLILEKNCFKLQFLICHLAVFPLIDQTQNFGVQWCLQKEVVDWDLWGRNPAGNSGGNNRTQDKNTKGFLWTSHFHDSNAIIKTQKFTVDWLPPKKLEFVSFIGRNQDRSFAVIWVWLSKLIVTYSRVGVFGLSALHWCEKNVLCMCKSFPSN